MQTGKLEDTKLSTTLESQIDKYALAQFLNQQGFSVNSSDLSVERIGDGLSNLTYLVRTPKQDLVLRRPPLPPYNPGAHDVIREARYMRMAGISGVPVPRVVATESSGDILGSPFVITEFILGRIITHSLPSDDPFVGFEHQVIEALVDNLVKIHQMDWQALGLGNVSHARGFLKRHVIRTRNLWDSLSTRHLGGMKRLTEWVTKHLPSSFVPGVMHGDYRSGNVMFDQATPPRISAVLDWENCGVGDPMLDLAYFVNTYPSQREPSGLLTSMSGFALDAGYPDRSQVLRMYEDKRGIELNSDAFAWYRAASYWHTAVGLESHYARVDDGRKHHDDLELFEQEVPWLIERALETIDGS